MKVLPAAMLAVTLFVAACGKEQAEPPVDMADPTASLHALFDEFFERGLELNPMRAAKSVRLPFIHLATLGALLCN